MSIFIETWQILMEKTYDVKKNLASKEGVYSYALKLF